MFRKALIFYLEFFKLVTLKLGMFMTIKKGPLVGKKWFFTKNSSNEYILGEYEEKLVELTNDLFSKTPNLVLFDIGAHYGYFSLLGSVYNNSSVHAFEPMPHNFQVLKSNVKRNKINNVNTYQLAISDHLGEIAFSTSPNSYANTYKLDSPMHSGDKETILVKTNFLDNMVFNEKIPAPNFIKIDVEGAELDVLKGAERTLLTYAPVIQIGTHDCHIPGITDKCLTFLDKMGYEVICQIGNKDETGLADFILKKLN